MIFLEWLFSSLALALLLCNHRKKGSTGTPKKRPLGIPTLASLKGQGSPLGERSFKNLSDEFQKVYTNQSSNLYTYTYTLKTLDFSLLLSSCFATRGDYGPGFARTLQGQLPLSEARPNKSCHESIRKKLASNLAIEGDIVGAYDNVNINTLIKIKYFSCSLALRESKAKSVTVSICPYTNMKRI